MHAHLALRADKTTYLTGEPIVLDLVIESAEPIAIDSTTAPSGISIDQVTVEPSTHVYPWLADSERFNRRWNDSFTVHPPTTRFATSITLNRRLRFDAEGVYTVHVVTARVRPKATSNDVTFTIVKATPQAEAERIAGLERAIRQGDECRRTQRAANELDWLADDVATEAKLRLLVGPDKSDCYFRHGIDGLWIATNRRRVIERLEQAIADPSESMPMGSSLLGTLIALDVAVEQPYSADADVPLDAPSGNGRQALAFDAASRALSIRYAHVLALGLPLRTGLGRVDSALRVMAAMRGSTVPADRQDFAAARDVLIDHFEDLDAYNVDTTINNYGAELRDPRIAPHLVRTLANAAFDDGLFAHTQGLVLKLLSQVDPAAGALALAANACSARLAQFSDFGDVGISTVPEADRCLAQKLREEAAGADRQAAYRLSYVTMPFVARFASAALVPQVEQRYATFAALPDRRAAHAAIAYLMRWQAEAGRPLLEAASTDRSLLFDLGAFSAPDADWFRVFLREHIAPRPDSTTSGYVYALGRAGTADDERFLESRLTMLHAQHAETPEEVQAGTAIEQALRCIGWRREGKRC